MWRVHNRAAKLTFGGVRRTIINPKIYHNRWEYNHDKKIRFYPVVGLRGIRTATMLLNKPNYQNKLSVECMEELYRFFRSFEIDGSVVHIWVENLGVNAFSHGIEYDEMLREPDYLRKLFQLAIMISKINKPIFGHAKGETRGAAAYILRTLSNVCANTKSTLRIDDIEKGWIPTCGGSYHLSRLTGDVGVYLALTGHELDADEMNQCQFVYGILRPGWKTWQYRKYASRGARQMPFEIDLNTQGYQVSFQEQYKAQVSQSSFQSHLQMQRDMIFNETQQRQDLIQLTASLKKEQVFNFANINNPVTRYGFKQSINNYFQYKQQTSLRLMQKNNLILPRNPKRVRKLPIVKINKHFYHDTLEQIIQSLETDKSEWAQQTLEKIKSRDPLAAKLTLRLIKQAKNLDYTSCLEQEYAVACNLLKSNNFQHYYRTKQSTLSMEQVTSELLDEFFAVNEENKLQHSLRKYSLYPTKEYRDALPDSVRMFLNTDYFQDLNRDHQHEEVDKWLHENSLSPVYHTFDVNVLRQKVYMKFALQRRITAELDNLSDILYNSQVERKYKKDRIEYIQKMFEDSEGMKQKVKQTINKLFNDRIKERLKDLETTADCYGREKRTELYVEIRKMLTKNRLTINQENEEEKPTKQTLAYFPNNSTKGIWETFNTELQKFPFSVLKNRLDNELLEAPYNDVEKLDLSNPFYPEKRKTQYTIENPNYRQYLLRYNVQPKQPVETFPWMNVVNKAREVSGRMNALVEGLTEQEIEERTMAGKYNFTLEEMLEKIQKTLKHDFELPQMPQPEIKLQSLLSQQLDVKQSFVRSFIDEFIPIQLKDKFGTIFYTIYDKLLSQHSAEHKLGQLGLLDESLKQTLDLDIHDYILNDVKFLFSHVCINEINQILQKIEDDETKDGQLLSKLQKYYNMRFQSVEDAATAFNIFLYNLVDLYGDARSRLILTGNKIIERMNRTQAFLLTSKSEPNVNSLLMAVSRERNNLLRRLEEKPKPFDQDAEYTIEKAEIEEKEEMWDEVDEDDNELQIEPSTVRPSTIFDSYHKATKRLITGNVGYLKQFSRLFMMAMGRENFLPLEFIVDEKLTKIPKFFDHFDNRKPVDMWFQEKFESIIRSIFDYRYELEQNFKTIELVAFDKELTKIIDPKSIKQLLLNDLDNDIEILNQIRRDMAVSDQQQEEEENRNRLPVHIKNPEALRKLNNFVKTIELEQYEKDEDDLYSDHLITLLRMSEEAARKKQPEKKLNEQELQEQNFDFQEQSEEESATENLERQLKNLTKTQPSDKLFSQLASVL